jgi:hypothetical protein
VEIEASHPGNTISSKGTDICVRNEGSAEVIIKETAFMIEGGYLPASAVLPLVFFVNGKPGSTRVVTTFRNVHVLNGSVAGVASTYLGAYADVQIQGGNWLGPIQIRQISVGGYVREIVGVNVHGDRSVDFYYAQYLAEGCKVFASRFENVRSALRGRLVNCSVEWNTFINSETSLYLDTERTNASKKSQDTVIANNTFENLTTGITRRDSVLKDRHNVVVEKNVFMGRFGAIVEAPGASVVWRNNRQDSATWESVVRGNGADYMLLDSALRSNDDVGFWPRCGRFVISYEDPAFGRGGERTEILLLRVPAGGALVSAAMRVVARFSDGDGPMTDVGMWIGEGGGPSLDFHVSFRRSGITTRSWQRCAIRCFGGARC